MRNQFVVFDIAEKLKELGFDEECFGYYRINSEFCFFADMNFCNTNTKFGFYPTAPLHQQVIDWFRTKHNLELDINIIPSRIKSKTLKYFWCINNLVTNQEWTDDDEQSPYCDYDGFSNYDDCRESMIYKAIEIVINNCNNYQI